MHKRVRLGTVSVRELVRRPGAVLTRVQDGERLIVCSHRRPVATLQPLSGSVVQPFEGAEYDIYGSPLGDAHEEAAKLDDAQRDILVHGQDGDRFWPWRGSGHRGRKEMRAAIDDLAIRGLIYKTERGWRLTGRGWMLREALVPSRPNMWDGRCDGLSPSMYAWLRSTSTWRLEEDAIIEAGPDQADESATDPREAPDPPFRPLR